MNLTQLLDQIISPCILLSWVVKNGYRLKFLFLKVELLFYYLCRAGLSGFNFNPLYDAGNIEFSFCYPGILIKKFFTEQPVPLT
jgi:hypothetical protein